MFVDHGIDNIKIIIRSSDLSEYKKWLDIYSDSFLNTNISFEEEFEPMGTLGYIINHLYDWIHNEDVFITNSDDIKIPDLTAMRAFQKKNNMLATVVLTEIDNPEEYGVASLNNGVVTGFFEKEKNPLSNLISTGVYLISPVVWDMNFYTKEKKNLMIENDLLPHLVKEKKLGGFLYKGPFFDCGTPARLEKAIKEVNF